MTSEARGRLALFGATVTGPRHRGQGHPNQDAWLKAEGAFGGLIAVCDGLGSRPASASGARLACRAVRRAVRQWPGTSVGADPSDLIRLVEALWRLSLPPLGAEDCATTCQFALREPGGALVLAGLGDGVVLVRNSGGGVRCLGGRASAAFSNETLGLGLPHRLRDWWVEVLPAPGGSVVVASDGVADDLRPDRYDALVAWLVEEIAPLPAHQRWLRLRAELHAWPVPHHTDDKTLAVMTEQGQEEPCPK